jgi:hypothetical protein
MFGWTGTACGPRRGGSLSETHDDVPEISGDAWEHDDYVRWSIALPAGLAERLAIEAERRGASVGDLLIEYAEAGLQRPA